MTKEDSFRDSGSAFILRVPIQAYPMKETVRFVYIWSSLSQGISCAALTNGRTAFERTAFNMTLKSDAG